MSDRYADWDAAYVLGALSPAERREFERHLSTCRRCRDAVAELAGLPPVLAGVGADTVAVASDRSTGPGPAVLAGLLRDARGRRRRVVALLSAAAASVVLVAGVLVAGVTGVLGPASASAVEVTLGADAPTSVTAEVVLRPRSWGTAVSTHCAHRDGASGQGSSGPGSGGEYGSGERYGLYVTSTSGRQTMVSSWRSGSSDDVRAEGSTALAIADMATLDIREIDTGTVVLRADVPR
ncbi:zf-HC2 domain-containing protein [Agromyces sp. MMS24-JH15]|uniref:zf-HC2 domain-containing protein n=1 Tax=Agromyces sp. MMS24-JH15 TaxID=3243765 RepID=UPI0037484148